MIEQNNSWNYFQGVDVNFLHGKKKANLATQHLVYYMSE